MKKLLLITSMLVALSGQAQQKSTHSVSLLWGSMMYYNDFGVSYAQTTGNVNAYADFKYSGSTGVFDQKYRHYTAHVGYVHEMHKFVDVYTAVGIHQENIYWTNEGEDFREIRDSFNWANGFLLRNKNRRFGFQMGFELDFINGVGVNIVTGLVVNL